MTLGACDLGGSSGGGAPVAASVAAPVAAATVIDLPAGQQMATLAWAASEGYVANYIVYESRNGGDYEYAGTVNTTRTTISGAGGDGVRVAVLAVNFNGTSSQASVPSPEIRFHDAAAAVAAGPPVPAVPTLASSDADSTNPVAAAQTVAERDAAENVTVNPTDSEESEATDDTTHEKISDSLRSLLLAGDARLPAAGLESDADAWLQARVDDEFRAGVRLVGTGQRDQDGLRELIWQDSAGQLIVSSGQAVHDLARTEDVPTTFEDAIRLTATERYVALADFDGDAVGDWIVEDSTTDEVWIINGVTLESSDARGLSESADSMLVGYGDFDGDARQEFLWQTVDGELYLGHPAGMPAASEGAVAYALEAGGRVLAVADVDGNGRDDIVTLDASGHIVVSSARGETESDLQAGPSFEVLPGAGNATEGLQAVATVDHDEDGRSEIVWLNGDDIEVWDVASGPEAF